MESNTVGIFLLDSSVKNEDRPNYLKYCPSCSSSLGDNNSNSDEYGLLCVECGLNIQLSDKESYRKSNNLVDDTNLLRTDTDSLTRGISATRLGKILDDEYRSWEKRLETEFQQFLSSVRDHFKQKECDLQEYQIDLCQREKDLMNYEEIYQEKMTAFKESEEEFKKRLSLSLQEKPQVKDVSVQVEMITLSNNTYSQDYSQSQKYDARDSSRIPSNTGYYMNKDINTGVSAVNVNSSNQQAPYSVTTPQNKYTTQHELPSPTEQNSSHYNGSSYYQSSAEAGAYNKASPYSMNYSNPPNRNPPSPNYPEEPQVFNRVCKRDLNQLQQYGYSNGYQRYTSPKNNVSKNDSSPYRNSNIEQKYMYNNEDCKSNSVQNSSIAGSERSIRYGQLKNDHTTKQNDMRFYQQPALSPKESTGSSGYNSAYGQTFYGKRSQSAEMLDSYPQNVRCQSPSPERYGQRSYSADRVEQRNSARNSVVSQQNQSMFESSKPNVSSLTEPNSSKYGSSSAPTYNDRQNSNTSNIVEQNNSVYDNSRFENTESNAYNVHASQIHYNMVSTHFDNEQFERQDRSYHYTGQVRNNEESPHERSLIENGHYDRREAPPYNGPPAYTRHTSDSRIPSAYPKDHTNGESAMIESRTLDVQVAKSKSVSNTNLSPLKSGQVKFGVAVLPSSSSFSRDEPEPDMTSTPVEDRKPHFPAEKAYQSQLPARQQNQPSSIVSPSKLKPTTKTFNQSKMPVTKTRSLPQHARSPDSGTRTSNGRIDGTYSTPARSPDKHRNITTHQRSRIAQPTRTLQMPQPQQPVKSQSKPSQQSRLQAPQEYQAQRPQNQSTKMPAKQNHNRPANLHIPKQTDQDSEKDKVVSNSNKYFEFSPTYKNLYQRYHSPGTLRRYNEKKLKEQQEKDLNSQKSPTWRSRSRLPNYGHYISGVQDTPVPKDVLQK